MTLLRSMLVGLDGSPYSSAAVELALSWAQRENATVTGIVVIDQADITVNAARAKILAAEEFEREMKEARDHADGFLATFSDRCKSLSVASHRLCAIGSPATQISTNAQRHDIVLLGLKTYFDVHSRGNDSTLRMVIKHSPRPVVVVPQAVPSGSTSVVAYDGSLQASRALHSFWASGLWKLHPVHVLSIHASKKIAATCCETASAFLAAHDISATQHCLISDAAPAELLLRQVADLDAGLLVMGAYGRQKLQEFLFGSVTRSVLSETKVPVFFDH